MILFEGLRGALSQIVYNRYTMAAAVGIISIIFLVSGMFLLTLYNLNLLAETLKSDMEVIAYFKSNVSPDRLQRIRDDVSGFREVGAITYISKEHAIEILSRDMVSIREMVQELRENPLPDSFRISLTQGARTPEGINALVNRLKEIKEIQKVDYGEEWVERLNVLIATAKIIGVIVGGILLLVVLFIVSNTIKFTLLTRHKEIEIMKFVGATNLFIRVPFIIEGGFLGLISAIVSIGMLFFTYKLILYKIPAAAYVWFGGIEFMFIPPEVMALFIGAAVLLGCFGSWVSVGKYLGVAIILILCLNSNKGAFAKANDIKEVEGQGIEEKIEESQGKLENINKQIREKKNASQKAAVEEKRVKQTIKVKEKDLSSKKKDIKEISGSIISKGKEIDRLQGDIEGMISDITAKKQRMKDFLRVVYTSHVSRNRGLGGVLLASADYHDFMMRSEYEDRLVGEVNREMKGLGQEVDQLEDSLLRLNRRHHALLTEKDQLLKDKARVERDVKVGRVRLASIQEKKAEYEQELKRLAGASAALKNLIASYESKRSEAALLNTGFEKAKGRLAWPLAGNVVSKFGRQKHPEFDAYVYKKGIEIASGRSSDVKAVYNGVVVYADWLKGYGLMVIIDHGQSYYSVYAHASRLLVSKGDKVKRGQEIAVAGNDNDTLSDREGIYFEIRYNGQPVDPLAWLSSNRG